MLKLSMALSVLVTGATVVPVEALACGDKFLVIGRGARRVQRSSHPAAILLYLRPGSALPDAARAMKLETTLKQAGHRVETVSEPIRLSEWLGAHRYDIVLTDLEAAAEVPRGLASGWSAPVVMPITVKADKQTIAAAEAAYPLVIQAPTKSLAYLSGIDGLMRRRGLETVASR